MISADAIELNGCELRDLPEARLRALLGGSLAMVFQDPMSALNPVLRVGRQLAEVVEVHEGVPRRAALARAVERLRDVRIPAPERRAHQYPAEFSGGMRQRAVIGQGLMADPVLILADEPTTTLDVSVQGAVLNLLREVRARLGISVLFISHNLAVVRYLADTSAVMNEGRLVEVAPTDELIGRPQAEYTQTLLAAVPGMGGQGVERVFTS